MPVIVGTEYDSIEEPEAVDYSIDDVGRLHLHASDKRIVATYNENRWSSVVVKKADA